MRSRIRKDNETNIMDMPLIKNYPQCFTKLYNNIYGAFSSVYTRIEMLKKYKELHN